MELLLEVGQSVALITLSFLFFVFLVFLVEKLYLLKENEIFYNVILFSLCAAIVLFVFEKMGLLSFSLSIIGMTLGSALFVLLKTEDAEVAEYSYVEKEEPAEEKSAGEPQASAEFL